jgi:hypothetical protein
MLAELAGSKTVISGSSSSDPAAGVRVMPFLNAPWQPNSPAERPLTDDASARALAQRFG